MAMVEVRPGVSVASDRVTRNSSGQYTSLDGSWNYSTGSPSSGSSESSVSSGKYVSSGSAQAQAASELEDYFKRITQITNQNNQWSAQQAAIQRDFQSQQNKIAMDFNAAEAAKNRDWQEYMSSTAHQREISDLKAAGLNPVLSAMGGNGAAVTSGATASGVTSAGAKGDTDESGASALVGLLSAFLNAQTQLQAMNTSAITNLAVADKYTQMEELVARLQSETSRYGADAAAAASRYGSDTSRYNAELNAQTALSTANISAMSSQYVARIHADAQVSSSQLSAEAAKVSASIHSAATKYAADKSYLTQTDVAKINGEVNKSLKAMGIKADFDLQAQAHANDLDLKKWYPGSFANYPGSIAKHSSDLGSALSGVGDLLFDFFAHPLYDYVHNRR